VSRSHADDKCLWGSSDWYVPLLKLAARQGCGGWSYESLGEWRINPSHKLKEMC